MRDGEPRGFEPIVAAWATPGPVWFCAGEGHATAGRIGIQLRFDRGEHDRIRREFLSASPTRGDCLSRVHERNSAAGTVNILWFTHG